MKIDLTGLVFGRLTVLNFVKSLPPRYESIWNCRCVCGNIVEVKAVNLRSGRTQSCGCLHKEQLADRNKESTKHGMWSSYYQDGNSSKLNRWYHHGMTQEQFLLLAEKQNFRCAICDEETKLFVDHDHKHCDGRKSCSVCQRGLICVGCNTGLGAFKDNIAALRAAAIYLEKFNNESSFDR